MEKLPVFLCLEGKKGLIVGGGRAALIKIKILLQAGINFSVIAKEFSEQTEQILVENGVNYQKKEIEEQDLTDIFVVFAAADKNINDMVGKWAKEKRILCCKADGTGDFIVPYHKREKKLTVAVSTDGLFPLVGKKLCENMDLSIGEKLEYLGEERKKIIKEIEDKQERKRALKKLLEEYL